MSKDTYHKKLRKWGLVPADNRGGWRLPTGEVIRPGSFDGSWSQRLAYAIRMKEFFERLHERSLVAGNGVVPA